MKKHNRNGTAVAVLPADTTATDTATTEADTAPTEVKTTAIDLFERYLITVDKPAMAGFLADIHKITGTDFGQADNLQVTVRKLALGAGYPAALEAILSDVRAARRTTAGWEPVSHGVIDEAMALAAVSADDAASALIGALRNGWRPETAAKVTLAVGTRVKASAAGIAAGYPPGDTWVVEAPTATTPKGAVRLSGERIAAPAAWFRAA